MQVGFTGTRHHFGMTELQLAALEGLLKSFAQHVVPYTMSYPQENWLHHGDCVGADAQAHYLAKKLGYLICLHPPTNNKYRAYCTITSKDRHKTPQPYLKRNASIVRMCQILIAAPAQNTPVQRGSGTWATIREAARKQRNHIIVFPDGITQEYLYNGS